MPGVSRTRSPLLIAELFYYVLDILAEPPDDDHGILVQTPDPDGREALANLAQTCCGFREPALNYLWRKMNSLPPLLLLFRSEGDILYMNRYTWVSESSPELELCLTQLIFTGDTDPS